MSSVKGQEGGGLGVQYSEMVDTEVSTTYSDSGRDFACCCCQYFSHIDIGAENSKS